MTLQLKTCTVSDIELPIIKDVEIEPLGEKSEIFFDKFIAHGTQACGYTWSYEAFLGDDLIEDSII